MASPALTITQGRLPAMNSLLYVIPSGSVSLNPDNIVPAMNKPLQLATGIKTE